jgi:hypothetical protein
MSLYILNKCCIFNCEAFLKVHSFAFTMLSSAPFEMRQSSSAMNPKQSKSGDRFANRSVYYYCFILFAGMTSPFSYCHLGSIVRREYCQYRLLLPSSSIIYIGNMHKGKLKRRTRLTFRNWTTPPLIPCKWQT